MPLYLTGDYEPWLSNSLRTEERKRRCLDVSSGRLPPSPPRLKCSSIGRRTRVFLCERAGESVAWQRCTSSPASAGRKAKLARVEKRQRNAEKETNRQVVSETSGRSGRGSGRRKRKREYTSVQPARPRQVRPLCVRHRV